MKFSKIQRDSDPSNFENLMIVDGLNLAFRYKHAGNKEFSSNYISTIQSLAKSYEAKKVLVLGDGGSAYRKKLDTLYKANREELKAKQTPEEAQDFKDFLEEFDKAASICDLQDNYMYMRKIGVEADDIAAYAATTFSNLFKHVWLISSDKDWDLLIDDNISRFSYVTRKEIKLENWDSFHICKPENYIDLKVLMGDKGDNVLGCAGIGEKRAYSLIRQYGTALDIMDLLPIPGKQQFIQNLNNFGDRIILNYELMDLVSYCYKALGNHGTEVDKQLMEFLYDITD